MKLVKRYTHLLQIFPFVWHIHTQFKYSTVTVVPPCFELFGKTEKYLAHQAV